jgi:hypothetical protein
MHARMPLSLVGRRCCDTEAAVAVSVVLATTQPSALRDTRSGKPSGTGRLSLAGEVNLQLVQALLLLGP